MEKCHPVGNPAVARLLSIVRFAHPLKRRGGFLYIKSFFFYKKKGQKKFFASAASDLEKMTFFEARPPEAKIFFWGISFIKKKKAINIIEKQKWIDVKEIMMLGTSIFDVSWNVREMAAEVG